MYRLAITLCIISQVFASIIDITPLTSNISGRIIGGHTAEVGEFPWQAAIYVNGLYSETFCSGALLNDQWVITSAYCIDPDTSLSFAIHLGMVNLNGNRLITHTTLKTIHPDFNKDTLENDVALLKFHIPITYTENIQPINFDNGDLVADGTVVTIAGWGQTSPTVPGPVADLQFVELVTISNAECQQIYGSAIKDSMVCAVGQYNEGFCTGDSGGALTMKNGAGKAHLVGIASFLSGNGCATTEPSGYTRASYFYDWIVNVTKAV